MQNKKIQKIEQSDKPANAYFMSSSRSTYQYINKLQICIIVKVHSFSKDKPTKKINSMNKKLKLYENKYR